jgi:hypothetical protein
LAQATSEQQAVRRIIAHAMILNFELSTRFGDVMLHKHVVALIAEVSLHADGIPGM